MNVRRTVIITLIILNALAVLLGQAGVLSTEFGLATASDTGSMNPVIQQDQLLVIDKTYNTSEATAGDIVVFRHHCSQDAFYAHQVVNVTDDGLITKGINNTHTDQLVNSNRDPCVPKLTDAYIVGEVTSIKSPAYQAPYSAVKTLASLSPM
jgi:signal peptidase I